MARQPDHDVEIVEEQWPAVMRLGTVARYLDCSTTTVNKLIEEGAFRPIYYGPGKRMRGVLRQDVDSYIDSLRADVNYPETEFEFSSRGRNTPKPKGPGSRLLWLRAAITYFRADRDAWMRRALYSERYLSHMERQLLSNLERLLPDKALEPDPRSGTPTTPSRYRSAKGKAVEDMPPTPEEYVENVRTTMANETFTVPDRRRPGEFETISATELGTRMAALWDLPTGVRGKLVFGGWRNEEEIANATDEELLQTEGMTPGTVRAIRKHIPRRVIGKGSS